jgi:transcription initiation factor TFIIH subunit 1
VNENPTETSGKNDLNKNLIKRFNFHSTMILKSTLGPETNNDSSTTNGMKIDDDDDDDDNVLKKFIQNDDLEDLRSEQLEETQTLKLVNPERYLRAPTTDRLQKNSVPQTPPTNLNDLEQEMLNWHVNTELNLNSTLADRFVKDLTPGGALMHGTTAQTLSQIVPQAIQEEMQTIYVSLSELLRHFWSSFPPSSPQIEEKIHRVHETIERFQKTQVNAFKEKVSTDLLRDFHLAGDMEDLIDTANKKYLQWTKTLSSTART